MKENRENLTGAQFNDILFPVLVEGEKIGIRAALEQAKANYPDLANDLEDAVQEIEEDTFLYFNEEALEGEFELSEKSKQAMLDALEKFRE